MEEPKELLDAPSSTKPFWSVEKKALLGLLIVFLALYALEAHWISLEWLSPLLGSWVFRVFVPILIIMAILRMAKRITKKYHDSKPLPKNLRDTLERWAQQRAHIRMFMGVLFPIAVIFAFVMAGVIVFLLRKIPLFE